MRRIKEKLYMGTFILAAFCLAGCSAGDEGSSGKKEAEQKKESSADVGQFAAEAGSIWNESWGVKRTDGEGTIHVDLMAHVEVPGLRQMSTVEVQTYACSERNKRKMAETIFDSHVSLYDEKHLPKFEIQERIDAWSKAESEEQKAVRELEGENGSQAGFDLHKENLREAREMAAKYERLLKKAPEDFTLAEGNFTGNDYIGKRDGIQYRLSFDPDGAGGFASINIFAQDGEVYPDGLKGEEDPSYMEYSYISQADDNRCSLEKEEAEKAARQFLQKLGFTDLLLAKETVLEWRDPEAQINAQSDAAFVDGWRFIFSPGTEGAPFSDYADFAGLSGVIVNGESILADCSITVAVTDHGVIRAKLCNPVTVISSVPGVKLLPLKDIKNVIRKELGVFLEGRERSSGSYSHLELGYYRLSDPEHGDRHTYLPVWGLWSGNEGLFSTFLVNAVDGSVIDLYPEWSPRQ